MSDYDFEQSRWSASKIYILSILSIIVLSLIIIISLFLGIGIFA